MADLSQIEVQNLKHLISSEDIAYQKLTVYAEDAVDPQIKQMFIKAAQDALNSKQKLLTFFN